MSDRSSDGNIDDPQFRWLSNQLDQTQQAGELVVLFGHHAINSLTNNEPNESAPPCTSDDGHGHDQNPGCDLDPRQSTPIHLGQPSQRPPGDTTQTLSELLLAHRNVIAFVAGHSHMNQVFRTRGRTAAEDSKGKAASFAGFALYRVVPGDIRATVSLTDIRRADNLADYTGALRAAPRRA